MQSITLHAVLLLVFGDFYHHGFCSKIVDNLSLDSILLRCQLLQREALPLGKLRSALEQAGDIGRPVQFTLRSLTGKPKGLDVKPGRASPGTSSGVDLKMTLLDARPILKTLFSTPGYAFSERGAFARAQKEAVKFSH